jgi:hypothetical protein
MNDRFVGAELGAAAMLSLFIGVGIGWFIWGRAPSAEPPRPEQRQADNSLELERAVVPQMLPAPPHEIPPGTKETRRVSLTLLPYAAPCPPVQLDLSVVRDREGGQRVIASSPDGRITGGVDVPIVSGEPIAIANPRPWTAGVSYAGQQAYGVFVHRDIWRLRFGVEVSALREGGSEARVLIGWAW